MVDNKKMEDVDSIVMVDDEKGSSVHFPTFLIGYEDGLMLKEEVHKKMLPTLYKYSENTAMPLECHNAGQIKHDWKVHKPHRHRHIERINLWTRYVKHDFKENAKIS